MTGTPTPPPALPDPRVMLDAVGDAIIATDPAGRITYWNAAAERLYGWRQSEVLGRDIVGVTTTEQSAADATGLMAAFARGETWTGEFDVQTKNGRRFPARVSNTPLYDENGVFAGVIGVSNDISERLAGRRETIRVRQQTAVASLAGSALREGALARVYEHTVEVVSEVLGTQACAVLLNEPLGPRLRVVAGRGLSPDAIGRSVGPSPAPHRLTGVQLLPGDDAVDGLELDIPGRHEAYGLVGVYTSEPRAFDPDEYAFLMSVAGVLGSAIARDEVERQLRQAQKLEAAGQLASGLAHDLNNVLMVIIGHAELLRGRQTDETSSTHVAAILDAAQRASALSRRLLSFVRPRNPHREPTSVGPAVEELSPLLRALAGPRITLTVELPETGLWAVVDVDELEQLVINLVANARDAIDDDGRIAVRLDAAPVDPVRVPDPPASGQWVRLRVIDDGRGMDEDTSSRAFDPFFTTKKGGSGTGLGLATVGALAHDLGGRASIESRPGAGTTVTVLMPRLPTPTSSPVQPAQPAASHTPASPIASARILVVEDHASVRTVLCQLLAREGYEVVAEGDAESALRLDVRPDLLISDVQLPGIGGPALAETLAARWPDLPVVLISGFLRPAHQGNARFLAKPFRPDELLRVVRAALDDADVDRVG